MKYYNKAMSLVKNWVCQLIVSMMIHSDLGNKSNQSSSRKCVLHLLVQEKRLSFFPDNHEVWILEKRIKRSL